MGFVSDDTPVPNQRGSFSYMRCAETNYKENKKTDTKEVIREKKQSDAFGSSIEPSKGCING